MTRERLVLHCEMNEEITLWDLMFVIIDVSEEHTAIFRVEE
jgi:hypothetical protein